MNGLVGEWDDVDEQCERLLDAIANVLSQTQSKGTTNATTTIVVKRVRLVLVTATTTSYYKSNAM